MSFLKHVVFNAQQIIYAEIYEALSKLGKIISLREIRSGRIGIREEFINKKLEGISAEDKGIESIRISLKENRGIFSLKIKKFMFNGVAEIPFEVESFTFNREVKKIRFTIGKKRAIADSYYSKLLIWFTLAVISAFNSKDNDLLKYVLKNSDYLELNRDGSYTIDFTKISGLDNLFRKPHWKFVRIDSMKLDREIIFLQLHKEFANKLVTLKNDVKGRVEGTKELVNKVSVSAKDKITQFREKLRNRSR